jgi:membrane-associated protease RseP (regulator of RpoE activity)
MSGQRDEPPSPEEFADVFRVEAVRRDDGAISYFGDPLVQPHAVVDSLSPLFEQRGYSVMLEHHPSGGPTERYTLVAEPDTTDRAIPWVNVGLLLATIVSTLYVGASGWYYIPVAREPLRILEAWPFVVSMLGVLGIHELGHYAAARYYGVDVTLPYFIPFPSLLGTMGAVINIRGRIPSRRALFDIGVAGPLAGLAATIVVSAIGFTLDPITVPDRVQDGAEVAFEFHDPLLMQLIDSLVTFAGLGVEYGPGESVHPVVFAGWAGMFFTFLNLLPVGQLDGGHIVRSIVGPRQETIAAAVPGSLFALSGYLYLTQDAPPVGFGVWTLWLFWGLLATGIAYAGSARPTVEEPLDTRRRVVGIVTFVLGFMCFSPIPFEIVSV